MCGRHGGGAGEGEGRARGPFVGDSFQTCPGRAPPSESIPKSVRSYGRDLPVYLPPRPPESPRKEPTPSAVGGTRTSRQGHRATLDCGGGGGGTRLSERQPLTEHDARLVTEPEEQGPHHPRSLPGRRAPLRATPTPSVLWADVGVLVPQHPLTAPWTPFFAFYGSSGDTRAVGDDRRTGGVALVSGVAKTGCQEGLERLTLVQSLGRRREVDKMKAGTSVGRRQKTDLISSSDKWQGDQIRGSPEDWDTIYS